MTHNESQKNNNVTHKIIHNFKAIHTECHKHIMIHKRKQTIIHLHSMLQKMKK